jgi:hypothetical protein
VRADELAWARELFGAIGAEAHAGRVEVVRG